MKFSTVLPLFVVASSVTAVSLFNTHQEKPILPLNEAVPGQSPLVYCGDTDDNILEIKEVNLTPNPPLPGKELTIQASGYLKQKIEDGAYILLEVKYGYIKLINETLDLCENVNQVDLKCPIEEGPLNLTKVVTLPKAIPPGKYHVSADVYNADDTPITCISADVIFKPNAF